MAKSVAIESCSPGDYLELFARAPREGWTGWGDQVETYLESREITPGYRGSNAA